MPTDDCENVAILLTAPGAAAIAVVRLVGPGVGPFLESHFSRPLAPGRAVHGELRDGGAVLDDPVVVFDQSRSLADVSLHGGTWVVRSFLELARREGFSVTESVAPPLDARAADATSEIDTEVWTHLPLARTELALRVLLAQPRAWDGLKRRAHGAMRDEVEAVLKDRALHRLLHPPRVVIVGAANAGKSTLANQLFAQERSITADLPGTTRDWIGAIANINGLAVMLVDTPGLRETSDSIESEAIAIARQQIERADLVVLVLDQTRPLEGEQEQLLALFSDAVVVVNKADIAASWHAPVPSMRTVATTGEGVDALRRAIGRHFGCDSIETSRPRWWTQRQRALLERALADPAALS